MSDPTPSTETTLTPADGSGDGQPAAGPAPEPAPADDARSRPAAGRAPRRVSWTGLAVDVLLVVLICVGVYFRFSWTNWSQDTDLHPDEYGLTGTLTRLRMPATLDEYFNTRLSPISPYQKYDEFGNPTEPGPDNRMRWGQWPIILLKWGAELTGNTGYREQRLFGRQMSALADTLALLVVALIGARLFNRRVGLLAAALSALAVMQIQQSHFMTSDNFGTLFTALALYAAVRVATAPASAADAAGEGSPTSTRPSLLHDTSQGWAGAGGWGWYLLFGVFFGMALASRINLAPLGGMILVASLIAHVDPLRQGRDPWAVFQRVLLLCALAGAAALATFRVTQPMTFRAEIGDTTLFTFTLNKDWSDSMAVAQAESNGEAGGPPAEQWTNRPALVFPWLNMVLWGMGLPLGLAAWGGFAWALWRLLRSDWGARFLTDVAPLVLPTLWVGGYFLFMGTRWVKSVRYFLPIYPFLALLAAWALVELWQKAGGRRPATGGARPADRLLPSAFALFVSVVVVAGTLAWAYGFTHIYRNDNTRVQASRWIYQNVPGPLNLQIETPDGLYTDPVPLPDGLQLLTGASYVVEVRPRVSGTLSAITAGRMSNAVNLVVPGRLRVTVAADPDASQRLGQADLRVEAGEGRGVVSEALSIPVEQDRTYYLILGVPEGGPLELRGAVVSNENWDEGLPLRVDGRDAFGGLYRGLTMEVHWLDNEDKRQMFLANLEQADYIFVQSQRRLWASTRIPARYPMTMEFYRALFDGRLGFELAAQFHTPITVGPLQVSDLTGAAAWGRPPDVPARGPDYPFNFSPFAAEEAFSVYDHAPVWIFRKRADFDFDRAAAILYAVDLSTVVDQGPRDATAAATLLMLPPDLLAIQRAGGTWRAMFDAASLLNTSAPVAVVVWYLALLALGVAAFPLTFAAFGGLSDRGYPLSRTVALLFMSWFVWMHGSLRLLPFTRATIVLALMVLALISAGAFWLKRQAIRDYVRARWRHLLAVEAVGLALFALMLFIRAGNPDLWHPSYGGEKPMDFSYFNAVLKSTYFPPYDPWLAGGYLNYYYYGFVVAGLLTKLLGVVPALAYNLILPMLFSLVGVNAFCVAYNLVEGARAQEAGPGEKGQGLEESPEAHPHGNGVDAHSVELPAVETAHRPRATLSPAAPSPARPNPYLAGIAAALLIVVLGNLGQVRTFLVGFQRSADRPALADSVFGDNDFTATLNGFWRVASGQTELQVRLGSWYWDATRIVPDVNQSGAGEITEFPFFTFLYADLHAHMIVMPFTVMAIAWAVAYLGWGREARRWWESAAMWALGGLVIGVTRPSNTWDYPMYIALGASAILAAVWLRHRPGDSWQAALLGAGARLAGLVALTLLLYRPFDAWVAVPLTELKLWEGVHTWLESYLYIYGLFLFVLASFVVIEARRWLAETPMTVLGRAHQWLPPVLFMLAVFVLAVGALLYRGVQTAGVALPLMAGAGLLALRRREALADEKRAVLFLFGTGLAATLFLDTVTLGGDRMNTYFKLSMQVWMLFSVAAGAALAWVWADRPAWPENWRGGWSVVLAVLVGAAALYTVTAASAKMRDRFPAFAVSPEGAGCQPIPGMPLPYQQGRPPEEQPWGLNGLEFMTWSAYCDEGYFLPLTYDYDAIRWLQDNVQGSPVIAEAQTFNLYRMASRYAWNTGLPNVVGWDWHQRQQRGAVPTGFITERGVQVSDFYLNPDEAAALAFLRRYDVRYVIVGPMERAYYPPEGLAKFERLAAAGQLGVVYANPGVTVYEVKTPLAGQ